MGVERDSSLIALQRGRVVTSCERLAPHPAAYPELILTSSEKGEGLATLRATIAALGQEG